MVVGVFSRTSVDCADKCAFTYHTEKCIKGQNNKPCDCQHHHFILDMVLTTPLFFLVTPICWVLFSGSRKTDALPAHKQSAQDTVTILICIALLFYVHSGTSNVFSQRMCSIAWAIFREPLLLVDNSIW